MTYFPCASTAVQPELFEAPIAFLFDGTEPSRSISLAKSGDFAYFHPHWNVQAADTMPIVGCDLCHLNSALTTNSGSSQRSLRASSRSNKVDSSSSSALRLSAEI